VRESLSHAMGKTTIPTIVDQEEHQVLPQFPLTINAIDPYATNLAYNV